MTRIKCKYSVPICNYPGHEGTRLSRCKDCDGGTEDECPAGCSYTPGETENIRLINPTCKYAGERKKSFEKTVGAYTYDEDGLFIELNGPFIPAVNMSYLEIDGEIIIGDPLERKEETADEKRPEEIKVEDLDLSVRSYNCLSRAGIQTLADIAGMNHIQLCRIRNLGRKSVIEVERKCREYGVEITGGEV